MKKQNAFFVDTRRCIGCFSCAMACKNQYHQPAGVKWRDVFPIDEEFYGVIRCSCDDYIGDLYCTVDGKELDVILKE